uniref:Cyanocobalamin reductase (cyanide-eliminating) n=1 Tax=Crassostrea virginica TaxID=6565 RepID=A0A8B8BYE2_CRAVI|nr:methylmalonic aciduria and homocystinuria type C protein homolog [Crassostrea virginica]
MIWLFILLSLLTVFEAQGQPNITETEHGAVLTKVQGILEPLGFEVYPFQVGWYNDLVGEKYKLPYHKNALGLLVLSIPDMWEKAFIPFVQHQLWDELHDPLDHFASFPEHDVEVMHQFEMPNGTARILVQTAAHVSGAAFYYQRFDVTEQPWPAEQKIYGVCYHPVYGGWISLDGVFIFKDVLCPDLPQRAPPVVIPSQKQRIELLEKYNTPPWAFRDLLLVPRKYADEHIKYLSSNLQQKIAITRQMKSTGA